MLYYAFRSKISAGRSKRAGEFETFLTENKTKGETTMQKNVNGKKRRSDAARHVALGGVIAALYVVLTLVSNMVGLASGVIQVRISEAMCVLPAFTTAAIPGLFIGCLLANLICGCALPDVILGSLATLLGALLTGLLAKKRWLLAFPPVVANMLVVPFVLRYVYGAEDAIPYMMLTVGAGELISCVLLGQLLYGIVKKNEHALGMK